MVDITPGDYKGCVDHMIPITRGGSMYNLGNLLALCKSCHDTKSILEKTSVAPVPIYMDADAKILPKDKADVVSWLAQQVQRKRSMEQQGGS
jgi:5-methylcytosine-specific restriction endonuclease McrA